MSTQPTGTNGNGIHICESTKKRIFETENDAEAFAENFRHQNGGVKQYAYACEHGNHFHLTTLSPEAYELNKAGTNAAAIQRAAESAPARRERRVFTDEEKRQMRIMREQGKSYGEIAQKLNRLECSVRNFLHTDREHAKTSLPTVESLSTQEQELEVKLKQLRDEKARLIELKKVKVAKLNHGMIAISKESQRVELSPEDALDVQIKLGEVLEVA